MGAAAGTSRLDLYDYRLQVAEMYRVRDESLQSGEDPREVLTIFRRRRDELFASHSQSALPPDRRPDFEGLQYFPYEESLRIDALVHPVPETTRLEMGTSGSEEMPMERVANVRFRIGDRDLALPLYWIDVYGGGLFLPFRDATAPSETYGGGRYLFDTVKGSTVEIRDRSSGEWRVTLDFNYAYNPSCAYDPYWACPLAPLDNHLQVRIEAGERRYM